MKESSTARTSGCIAARFPEVAVESERETLPGFSQDEKRKKRRPYPGLQKLPADLPRVEKIVACTPEQCECGSCGAETKVIGYEVSEVLDAKPAEYFVQVLKREKRACQECEEQGVATARVTPRRNNSACSNCPEPPLHSGDNRLGNFLGITLGQLRRFTINSSFRRPSQFIEDRNHDLFADASAVRCLNEMPSCNRLHNVVPVVPHRHCQAELVMANLIGINARLRRNHVVQWR